MYIIHTAVDTEIDNQPYFFSLHFQDPCVYDRFCSGMYTQSFYTCVNPLRDEFAFLVIFLLFLCLTFLKTNVHVHKKKVIAKIEQ